MRQATILKYSNGIRISNMSEAVKHLMTSYLRAQVQYGMVMENRRLVRKPLRVFAGTNKARDTYMLHLNQFDELMRKFKFLGISQHDVEIIEVVPNPGDDVAFTMASHLAPRDYQVPIIDYIQEPGYSKVVVLSPGGGKTLSSLFAVTAIGKRTVLIASPKYMAQWLSVCEESMGLVKGEILVIRGSKALGKLISMRGTETLASVKLVIISQSTYSGYIKAAGNEDLEAYHDVLPCNFFETLGVGVRILDECHERPHGNYLIDINTNVAKTIYLSATINSIDPLIARIYTVLYPESERYIDPNISRHIHVVRLEYKFQVPARVRCLQQKAYNHMAMENYLIKQVNSKKTYINMLTSVVDTEFIEKRKAEDKGIIFCATVEMCELVRDSLMQQHPHMKIAKYTAEDPREVLLDNNLITTTVLSAGTGIDIACLTFTLNTIAMRAPNASIQVLGRLRKIKDRDVSYFYLVGDIPKHQQYADEKMDLFKPYALTHKTIHTDYRVFNA